MERQPLSPTNPMKAVQNDNSHHGAQTASDLADFQSSPNWPQFLAQAGIESNLFGDQNHTSSKFSPRPEINLMVLQAMSIYQLQRELLETTQSIRDMTEAGHDTMKEIRKLLKEYFEAIREFEFLKEASKNVSTSTLAFENLELRQALSITGLRWEHTNSKTTLPPFSNWFDPHTIMRLQRSADQHSERKVTREAFLRRFRMALFGGLALIVPMIVMILHPGKLTNLLTTSLFVLGVAIALANFMTDAASKDIIGATAAYAAVLVVFVGTNGGTGV